MAIKIRKNAFLSALAGAKAANPNEFICLLRGKRMGNDIVIDDTLIPPGIMTSSTMTSFSDWMLPWIEGLVGTFHSHPGGSARPSRQDGWLFSHKGGVHFIAAEPFGARDVAAYLGDGRKVPFEVIDDEKG
ncbi:MAG: Mov34/MPN/PAD-1 family protein [Candidatus Micrarchaeota archaeon]|nr:Mov34/MPN/PAD-1 family protein [Candidatus Micrarchaeota archaeon]